MCTATSGAYWLHTYLYRHKLSWFYNLEISYCNYSHSRVSQYTSIPFKIKFQQGLL